MTDQMSCRWTMAGRSSLTAHHRGDKICSTVSDRRSSRRKSATSRDRPPYPKAAVSPRPTTPIHRRSDSTTDQNRPGHQPDTGLSGALLFLVTFIPTPVARWRTSTRPKPTALLFTRSVPYHPQSLPTKGSVLGQQTNATRRIATLANWQIATNLLVFANQLAVLNVEQPWRYFCLCA